MKCACQLVPQQSDFSQFPSQSRTPCWSVTTGSPHTAYPSCKEFPLYQVSISVHDLNKYLAHQAAKKKKKENHELIQNNLSRNRPWPIRLQSLSKDLKRHWIWSHCQSGGRKTAKQESCCSLQYWTLSCQVQWQADVLIVLYICEKERRREFNALHKIDNFTQFNQDSGFKS